MYEKRLLLIGCGILSKEIRYLTKKNVWPMDAIFIDSSLHIDLKKLERSLKQVLAKHRGRDIIVFFGTCHPLMNSILEDAETVRTEGQNCVEMLLGHDVFTQELSQGAFFLLEDWARRWELIQTKTLGTNLQVIREIYQCDRKYILCLKTPCSEDFNTQAEKAGEMVGLPIRWMDVSLEHLESVIQAAIDRKMRSRQ